MTTKKAYNKLIDDLRIVAAILVVAIHTAPFVEFNEVFSYIITNIIGRLAVPFFFVLSGYFLFRKFKYLTKEEQYQSFIKTELSLLKTYALTFIIYIPVWIYLHGIDVTLFVKDLLWDGLHYHLWYFPALIVGIAIVYFLNKHLKFDHIFIVVVLLYLVGALFNVYGPLLPEALVNLMGNTRNGIFFAPLFIFIGLFLALKKLRFNNVIVLISVVLFLFEPLLLYFTNLSDPLNAMFLTLPITVYFLMTKVLAHKGRTHNSLFYHNVSLYIYVIHPVVILGNRLIVGKILNMELTNTLNFVLTTVFSLLAAYVYQFMKEYYEKNKSVN